jgi:serine/threonine protein kinase
MSDRYKVVEDNIGQGGFGRIDKAFDEFLERHVAIKTLDPLFKSAPTKEDRERFKREAKNLASLTHPNIPAIYDVQFPESNSEFKIIFQWIDGITVREYLTDYGVLSLDQVKHYSTDICMALNHAHENNIIHRDIKPSNLIITKDKESCYIVDFGISLKSTDIKRITGGTPIGTPGYMSPEQERGDEIDLTSDIFSLGVVLYECLAGTKPTVGQYKPLSAQNETIPPTIDELIKNSLVDTKERVRSAQDFLARLQTALRPPSSFSKILAEGALHEIYISLTDMDPDEYSNLPLGQRRLILSRLKDLIRVDEMRMRKPIASLLSQLVRVSSNSSESDFSFIIDNSILFGFEKEYSGQWRGDVIVRNALCRTSLICNSKAHNILGEQVLKHWDDISNIMEYDSWYRHDLRKLLQNLLANDQCSNELSEILAIKLDKLNELSHN